MKAAIVLAGLVMLPACQEESGSEPAPTATPAPDKPTTASGEVPPTDPDEEEEIPTEEDFEEEALQEITVDNLEAELDKLEAEIGQ